MQDQWHNSDWRTIYILIGISPNTLRACSRDRHLRAIGTRKPWVFWSGISRTTPASTYKNHHTIKTNKIDEWQSIDEENQKRLSGNEELHPEKPDSTEAGINSQTAVNGGIETRNFETQRPTGKIDPWRQNRNSRGKSLTEEQSRRKWLAWC
jgi:hypothetical protein